MRYLAHGPTPNETTLHIGSALTPPMHRTSVGKFSGGLVYGRPGTQAVMIKGPGVENSRTAQASAGLYRSSDSPDVIYPPLYWEAGSGYGKKEHAPVSRISDNQMPVPALRPPNVLVFKTYIARKGGQRQVKQPQVVQTWPGMNNG